MKNRPGSAHAGESHNTLTPVMIAMVNEFSDVFSAVVGFSELAAASRSVRDDPKLATYINEIHKSGLRGSLLLRQWMNQTRAHDGNTINDEPQT